MVQDPSPLKGGKGFEAFLEQRIAFVPHNNIIEALMPIAGRQKDKKLRRQLIRYLQAEWNSNAKLYALDKEVRFLCWREILEQCGVKLEKIRLNYRRFCSRLANVLTSLHEDGFIKVWHLQGADEVKSVAGKIYKHRNSDEHFADAVHDPLQSLVRDPSLCMRRNGFDAFLEQKIGFVPDNRIVESLRSVAKRQKKSHV